jgi:hypothetical protein
VRFGGGGYWIVVLGRSIGFLIGGGVRRGWGGFRGWGLVLFCFGELIFLFVRFWGGGEGRVRKRESESVNVGWFRIAYFPTLAWAVIDQKLGDRGVGEGDLEGEREPLLR